MSEFGKRVLVGFGALASAVTVFLAGMQIGSANNDQEVRLAKSEGRTEGFSEALRQYEQDEKQLELIARLFGIIRNPELLKSSSEDLMASVVEAESALARGDVEAAINSLPDGVFEAPATPCVEPNSRYLMDTYAKFDVCSTDAAITFDGLNVIGRLDIFSNGVFEMLSPGEKISLPQECSLQFVRTEDFEDLKRGVLIELYCPQQKR